MFEAEVPHEALRAWAAAHGLTFKEEGLLPPICPVLKQGLGAGDHLAGLITSQSDHGYTAKGGFTKRAERHTFNLCEGVLPGGLRGVLAHHQHLELRSGGESDSWVADVDTVVIARLPERSRAVCELRAAPGTPWVATPPEDQATLDLIGSPNARAALARAPATTQVELIDGVLAVWARGIIEDAGALDALCAVASTVADGVRAAVARHGDLAAGEALPPPRTQQQQWLDQGVATVSWAEAPPSVVAARLAYEPQLEAGGRRSGRQMRGLILVVGTIGSFLWAAVSFGFGQLFDSELEAAAVAVAGFLYGIYKTIGAAFEEGEITEHEHVVSQAGPWGLEAFARGYAQARGLVLEDPDAFRRGFPSPLPGRPQRAMHGDLGGCVRGHLTLWRDPALETFWLMAVVPAPSGDPAPVAAPPYQATLAGASLIVGRQVTEAERSASELDALVAEALRLAPARTAVA